MDHHIDKHSQFLDILVIKHLPYLYLSWLLLIIDLNFQLFGQMWKYLPNFDEHEDRLLVMLLEILILMEIKFQIGISGETK